MKAIKCELCGSNQLIKKDGYYQCEHCCTKYTLEEAKKLIVSGTVEVVTGNAEKERLLKNAETYINLERYDDASKLYDEISHNYPDDYRGWWGLVTSDFRYKKDENYYYSNNGIRYDAFKAVYDLAVNKDFIFDFIDKIIISYGNSLHLSSEPLYFDTYPERYNDRKGYYQIDSFTKWLIFSSRDICDIINYDKFNNFIISLSNRYEQSAKEALILPCFENQLYYKFEIFEKFAFKFRDDEQNPYINLNTLLMNGKLFRDYDSEFRTYLMNFIMHNIDPTNYAIRKEKKNNKIVFSYDTGLAFYGKWLFIHQGGWDYDYDYLNRLPVIVDKNLLYKAAGFCQHCGGKFKGVFNMTCSKCGKPKDY